MLLDRAPRQIDLFMPATVIARYADVAELAAEAARHGIAHNYLSWPGVGVVPPMVQTTESLV